MSTRNVLISIAALAVIAATTPFAFRIAQAGGGGCRESMSDAGAIQATLQRNCFTPTVIRIQSGASITWTNLDEVPHTVSGANNTWGSYDELALNDQAAYRFDDSGVFPYFCALHPSMIGAVVVGDGTAADGLTNASITSLRLGEIDDPAGETDTLAAESSDNDISRTTMALGGSAIALVATAIAGLVGYARPWRRIGG